MMGNINHAVIKLYTAVCRLKSNRHQLKINGKKNTGQHIMSYAFLKEKLEIHYHKIRDLLRDKGFIFVMRMLISVMLGYPFYKIFKSGTFRFRGKTLHYFYHPYNVTWMSERAVEIPIIWDLVKRHNGKNILEFGNVLSHYFKVDHDILDKYEKAYGIINQDVVDFRPRNQYDLIVSISTLEHVGWEENIKHPGREPDKIPWALTALQNCLAPGGYMIFTIPFGQNQYLDSLLSRRNPVFSELFYLKRMSNDNRWQETCWTDIARTSYDHPYISANGLVIAVVRKNGTRGSTCLL
jgi:hypothetical protein